MVRSIKYGSNYCEKNEIPISNLSEAQRTLYFISENMKMNNSISKDGYEHFQRAIEALAIIEADGGGE